MVWRTARASRNGVNQGFMVTGEKSKEALPVASSSHTFYRNRRGARYTPSTRSAVNRRSPGKLHELNHLSADIVSTAISISPTKGGTLYIYIFLTNFYLLTLTAFSSTTFPSSSFVQIYLKFFPRFALLETRVNSN